MNYNNTIQDIIEYTGLKYDYVSRCTRELEDVLQPYMRRGDNNSILFASSALQIFDTIKQLKEKKYSISAIRTHLEESLQNPSKDNKTEHKNSSNPTQNHIQNDITKLLLERLDDANKKAEDANKRTFEVLEKSLQNKDETIQVLKNQVRLLTDGRDPEEVRKEREAKERSLKEKEELLIKVQTELTSFQEKESKRVELLNKLEELEGMWFVGRERKAILKELAEIA